MAVLFVGGQGHRNGSRDLNGGLADFGVAKCLRDY